MEIKLEGRQVDIGDELKGKIQKRLDNMDQRFGPFTHARLTLEKKPHKNEQRAHVTVVINVVGKTITVEREASTILNAVDEALDVADKKVRNWSDKRRKDRRSAPAALEGEPAAPETDDDDSEDDEEEEPR